jgi:hypothetical protein
MKRALEVIFPGYPFIVFAQTVNSIPQSLFATAGTSEIIFGKNLKG